MVNINHKKQKPSVSVIIPVYNAEFYIGQTLDSITSQNIQNFEVIVVDDGSTDQTATIVKNRPEAFVHYFYQDRSGGPAKPRNRAIEMSRSDYIAVFDSDDLMLPNKLSTAVSLLNEHQSVGMVFTDFNVIDEENKIIRSNFLKPYVSLHSLSYQETDFCGRKINANDVFQGLIYNNFVGTSGVVARKKALLKAGGFLEKVRNADDKLMWIKIAEHFDMIYLPEVYHLYRSRKGSITLLGKEEKTAGVAAVLTEISKMTLNQACRKEIKQQQMLLWGDDGIAHFEKYDLVAARCSFIKSFLIRPNWKASKYLILSLLGSAMIRTIKLQKEKWSKK